MDDQQRLDRIVEWMHTVGDPWMRDEENTRPEAGSDLAGDDAEPPQTSPLTHRGIVMALDHLGSVVDAMVRDRPKRLKAHFTVLRTALESAVRVRWLLESDSSNERRLRGIQYRFENLEEQRKAITDLSGIHIVGERDEARADNRAGDQRGARVPRRCMRSDIKACSNSAIAPRIWKTLTLSRTRHALHR